MATAPTEKVVNTDKATASSLFCSDVLFIALSPYLLTIHVND